MGRYVDTRTGRAGSLAFREQLFAGWDTNNWFQGFSADAETVDMMRADDSGGSVTRDLVGGTTTRLVLSGDRDQVASFPVGRGWLVGVPDGTAYWYPPGATEPAQRMSDHTSWMSAAATDAAGSVLVTAADQRLVVSDLVAGRWVRREVFAVRGGTILALAVNRQGTRAYSSGDDGTVTAWDLTDREGFGAQIRQPQIAGADPFHTVVIGDAELAGRTGEWVVPVMLWRDPPVRDRWSRCSWTRRRASPRAASRPASAHRWARRDRRSRSARTAGSPRSRRCSPRP